jgi:hypothetical protein
MRGNFIVFKVLGFIEATLLFIYFGIFLTSCKGLEFEDETTGELKLAFAKSVETKSVVRDFPDSNKFILTIKSSSGSIIYNGLYGNRPAKIELDAGSYEIAVVSRDFTIPEFEAPCYSDCKTVVVKAGETCVVLLTAVQSNAGLRLTFTQDFVGKFSGYTAELSDIKGKIGYPFTESRFAYMNPGIVTVRLLKFPQSGSGGKIDTISVVKREMAARDMLTLNLHATPSDASSAKSGILIDTSSRWLFEQIVIGSGGDGLSKDRAMTVDQLVSNIGAKGIWVTGYIVGGDLTSTAIKFEVPFTKDTNLAIAASPTERERDRCISVCIPNNDIRQILNLCTNPGNLGKKVYIKGTVVGSYMGMVGLNPITEAQF